MIACIAVVAAAVVAVVDVDGRVFFVQIGGRYVRNFTGNLEQCSSEIRVCAFDAMSVWEFSCVPLPVIAHTEGWLN